VLERESLHLSCSRCPARRTGGPGWPTTWPTCRAAASSTRSPSPRPTSWPPSCAAAGIAAASYSGRTDDAERRAAEDDLLANRIKVLVATSALGMGFDKPDLGFVVHLGRAAVADRLLPAGGPRRAAA
jgi:ATP-dependent DNA helicase RecQ